MPDIILGEFSTDVTPPEVTNPSPTGTGAAKTAPVEFDITDIEAGVDTSSLHVTISGVDAIVAGVFQTPSYDGTISNMGGGTWHVTVSTHPDFASYVTIGVTVDGQDLAPVANVMAQYSWSFITEDSESPYVGVGWSPTGIDVAIATNIEFDINDDGAGVDITTVIVTINGIEAYNWDGLGGNPNNGFKPGFQGIASAVTGTPVSYHFVIDPDPVLSSWTSYEVIINADDLAV